MASSAHMEMTKQQLAEEVERLERKLAEYEARAPDRPQSSPPTHAASAPDADGARFRALLDHSLDSFIILSPDGHIQEANDRFINLIGCSRDDLPSMHVSDVVAGETPQGIQGRIAALSGGGAARYETRLRRKDGRLVEVEAHLRSFGDTSGQLYCFIRDITGRRLAETSLRLAQYTLDHTSEAILWADPDGVIVYANDAACRMSHAPPGSMIGHRVWDFNRALDETRWHKRWERLKKTGFEEITITVTGPGGETTEIAAVMGYIRFDDRELFVSFGRDISDRQQMETAILKANEKFGKLFHTSPVGISISTVAEGRYLDVNDAFLTLFGFDTREEVIGKTSRDLNTWVNIADRPSVMRALRERPRRGAFFQPFRRRSGEVREGLCAHDVIELDGEDCVVVMFQDVTESRKTEAALRESEERYHQVFSTVSDAIMLIDVETHGIIDANDGGLRMYGYDRDEMLGLKLDDITTDLAYMADLAQRTRDGALARVPVGYHIRKDGTVFPVEISADLVELRGRAVLVEVVRDISERLRAEEILRENEETLRTLVRMLPVGVALVSPERQIVQLNPALEKIFGLSKEQLLTGTYRSRRYLRGDGTPMPPNEYPTETAVADGQIVRDVEIGVVKEDGTLIWTTVSAAPLPDGSVVTVSADITERKLADEELAQHREHLEELVRQRTAELQAANEHLEALSQLKDEFVSNVSHELRTPITSLKLFVDLLKLRPDNSDIYQEHIKRELKRLEVMVEDLLRLSRLDSEQAPLALGEADVNQLVAQMVSDRQSLAESQGLSLSARLEPGPLMAVIDQGLIGQVLSVLLTNAFNYTPSGGEVIVRTERQRIEGRAWVGFSVRDSGPGFPAEERARLFTRFFRGKAGRASGAAGTGLGLAIAREIVDRHEGRIEAGSNGIPGEGAVFSVWLPRVSDPGGTPS